MCAFSILLVSIPFAFCDDEQVDNQLAATERVAALSKWGEVEALLRRIEHPVARARLALLINADNLDFRLLGVSTSDSEEAAHLASTAASQLVELSATNTRAKRALSLLCRYGVGVEKDVARAFQLMREASDKGDEWATHNVAIHYLYGVGVKQDRVKAISLLESIAKRGNPAAMFDLASTLGENLEPVDWPIQAKNWCLEAAKLGNIEAAFNWAQIQRARVKFSKGSSSLAQLTNNDMYLRDYISYIKIAAEGGHVLAMLNLSANLKMSGREESAFEWSRRAAKSGFALAVCHLALFYYFGEGCDQDTAESKKLLQKALELAKLEPNPKLERDLASFIETPPERKREAAITLLAFPRSTRGFGAFPAEGEGVGDGDLIADTNVAPKKAPRARRKMADANTQRQTAQLLVIDTAVADSASGRYFTLDGRVKNSCREVLDDVVVTVSFEDSAGKLVKTSRSMLSPNPLQPGEIGTFSVVEQGDPRIADFRLSFQRLGGASLTFDRARQ